MNDLGARPTRRGFTIVEVAVALAVLSVALLLVVEAAVRSLAEREAQLIRQEALETCSNVLEIASALPWRELTPEWAARQQLPPALAERLTDGRLTVRVEPEPGRPRTKRVTATVQWNISKTIGNREVQLVGRFSTRSVAAPGGTP